MSDPNTTAGGSPDAGLFRRIPPVDAVLACDALVPARERHPHRVVVGRVREVLEELRRGIAAG